MSNSSDASASPRQNYSELSSIYQMKGEEQQFCFLVRVLLNFGFGGVICITGMVANLIAYVVLNKGYNSAPVATFLLRSLALTDNFFLLVWFVNFAIRDFLRFINFNSAAWLYVRLYSYPTLYIAQFATIWMTVLIAAARYIAVCKPYISRRVCSIANVKLAVLGLYLLVIVYNLPHYFEMEVRYTNGTESGRALSTWLGRNKKYNLIYNQIMYYLFTFALPLLVLCVLNIRLTVAYRAIAERRRRMRGMSSRSQQDDANITLVMIVVIAVFVLCQAPGRIAQIIWNYNFSNCRTAPFFIQEIATIFEVLNSSINFLIYCCVRPQFRRHLRATLCCRPSDTVSEVSVRLMSTTCGPNGTAITEGKTEATFFGEIASKDRRSGSLDEDNNPMACKDDLSPTEASHEKLCPTKMAEELDEQ